MPILWYVFKILDPPSNFIDEITKLCENFVWKGSKRWVGRHFLYLPLANGGIGVRHPLVQVATFRVSFVNKLINFQDLYFCAYGHRNILNILTDNKPDDSSPFYDNLSNVVKTVGLRFENVTEDLLHSISLSNTTFFNNVTFPNLVKSGYVTVGDFLTHNPRLSQTRPPSKRLTDAESRTLRQVLDAQIISDLATLQCRNFGSSENYQVITKATLYLVCTPVASKISWPMADPEIINADRWEQLKRAEVTNPEKDIVYKIWHKTGLTPKLADAMNLREGRDCPFCNFKNINSGHYPF